MSKQVWKVKNEDKYFKKQSEIVWFEFLNGNKVLSLEFIKEQGDSVVLKRTDGFYLRLEPERLLIGSSENDYNRIEYYGNWIKEKVNNEPKTKWWNPFPKPGPSCKIN